MVGTKRLQLSRPSTTAKRAAAVAAPLRQPGAPTQLAGLANLGNTCYLNSVLQVLLHSPGLRPALHRLAPEEAARTGGARQLMAELARLFDLMADWVEDPPSRVPAPSGPAPLGPVALLTALRERHPVFRSTNQHDAQELLRCLLTSLQEADAAYAASTACAARPADDPTSVHARSNAGAHAWNCTAAGLAAGDGAAIPTPRAADAWAEIPPGGDASCGAGWSCSRDGRGAAADGAAGDGADGCGGVRDLFEGELEYTTRCLQCDASARRRETFCDLSLAVSHQNSLSWCLERFFAAERLRGDDKYYCDGCAALTEAIRRPSLARLAPTLTIHLKRFQHGAGADPAAEAQRVGRHVAVPERLSLRASWCHPDTNGGDLQYSLFGVVAHAGRSGCGHYTCVVRAPSACQLPPTSWLRFDDEECTLLSADEVHALFSPASQSAALACMLFYARVDGSV